MAVLRRRPDGSVDEVLPDRPQRPQRGARVRRWAWWVHDGVLWFADWATQRLHRLEPGGSPVPLTPEPEVLRGLRYADGDLHPDGTTLLCVQEEHHADGREATNTIVRLAAHAPGTPEVGRRGTGLRRRTLAGAPTARRSAGSSGTTPTCPGTPRGSWSTKVGAARWWPAPTSGSRSASRRGRPTAPSGSSATAPGFWSLYRWTPDGGRTTVVDLGLDVGHPQWVFGQSSYAFLGDGRVVLAYSEGGLERLAVWEPDFGRVAHPRPAAHGDRHAAGAGDRRGVHRRRPHQRAPRRRGRCRRPGGRRPGAAA